MEAPATLHPHVKVSVTTAMFPFDTPEGVAILRLFCVLAICVYVFLLIIICR